MYELIKALIQPLTTEDVLLCLFAAAITVSATVVWFNLYVIDTTYRLVFWGKKD